MDASLLRAVDLRLAFIGLGYLGLLLAIEFGKQCYVLDFDINQARVDELKSDSRVWRVESRSIRSQIHLHRRCNLIASVSVR